MSDQTAVAPATGSAVATQGNAPAGFGNITGADLATPAIKLWHPLTPAAIEGAKLGDFYDVNAAKTLGNNLTFFILAQKTREFVSNEDSTVKMYKHLLVVLDGKFSFPCELILSAGALSSVKKLFSTLFVRSQESGGAPLYGFLVSATGKVIDGKKGKYAAPEFSVTRSMTPDEEKSLSALYGQYGLNYDGQATVGTEEAFSS